MNLRPWKYILKNFPTKRGKKQERKRKKEWSLVFAIEENKKIQGKKEKEKSKTIVNGRCNVLNWEVNIDIHMCAYLNKQKILYKIQCFNSSTCIWVQFWDYSWWKLYMGNPDGANQPLRQLIHRVCLRIKYDNIRKIFI